MFLRSGSIFRMCWTLCAFFSAFAGVYASQGEGPGGPGGPPSKDPIVEFAYGDSRFDEAAGRFTLQINLSSAAEEAIAVPYTITGSATEGEDFLAFEPASELVFEAGTLSRNLSSTIVDDDLFEGVETVFVHLKESPDYKLGKNKVHRIWIVDNDKRSLDTPTGLTAKSGPRSIKLRWKPNTGPNIRGYYVYRDTAEDGAFNLRLTDIPHRAVSYIDRDIEIGQTYFYKISAVSASGAESPKSEAVSAATGVVEVTMPDYRGAPGATVLLQINSEYAQGVTGNGMDIQVTFDSSVLTPQAVHKTVLTQGFQFVENFLPNQINISGVSAEGATIKGEGHLLEIEFSVDGAAAIGATAQHAFVKVKMFDVDANALLVDFSDTALFTVASGYALGDVDGNGVVDSGDALLALQHATGQRVLSTDPPEFQAADVNGDGAVDGADVTLILRLAVGLPIHPDEENAATGALLGAASVRSAAPEVYEVTLPNLSSDTGQVVTVPVEINSIEGVAGMDLMIAYDPSVLVFDSLAATSLTQEFALESMSENGWIQIVLSSPVEAGPGSGAIFNLTFLVLGELDTVSPLAMSMVKLTGEYGEDLAWDRTVRGEDGLLRVESDGSAQTVRALVDWFYNSVLGRRPEAGAVDAWQHGFYDAAMALSLDVRFVSREMGRLFFLSEEYEARERSDAEFIADCYHTFLLRDPDEDSFNAWMNDVDPDTGLVRWNRGQVMTMFAESQEFSDLITGVLPNREGEATRNFVTTMYIGIFDRLVDSGGLLYWADVMNAAEDKKQAARNMAELFFNSEEGLSKAPTNELRAIRLYRAFLGRFPADGEVLYWSGQLEQGIETLESLIARFVDSEEFATILGKYFSGQ